MSDLQFFDNAETIELWHRNDESVDVISPALLRRFRHRSYEKTAQSPVPENNGHWYFALSENIEAPLPGDEIVQDDDTVWTISEVNASPVTKIWQCVCVSSAKSPPTEFVDIVHPAEETEPLLIAEFVPARAGELTLYCSGGETVHLLTLYLKGIYTFEAGDFLRRSDGSYWSIKQVVQPIHRSGWTKVNVEK